MAGDPSLCVAMADEEVTTAVAGKMVVKVLLLIISVALTKEASAVRADRRSRFSLRPMLLMAKTE